MLADSLSAILPYFECVGLGDGSNGLDSASSTYTMQKKHAYIQLQILSTPECLE